MNLGVSLGCFRKWPIDSAMDECIYLHNNFSINSIEIRFERECDIPSLWPWEITKEFESFLSHFDIIGAHLPFSYLNPICPNPYIKDESVLLIKQCIEKASDLGMNYVVMHARGNINGVARQDQLYSWLNLIKDLTQYSRSKSITLTIENADSFGNLYELSNIIKKIDSKWLKMTLDVGHAYLREVPHLSTYPMGALALRGLDPFLPFFIKRGMPYEQYGSLSNFLRCEMGLVANMHIHDYNGRRDHLLLGKGKISFDFLKDFSKSYKGTYILETKLANRKEFQRNLDFLKRIFH